MGSQYAYGEQNNAQMPYYAAPRGFNTVAEHIKAGQAVEHIPHRLFVGGFGAQITEAHLREHFERFFTIRDVKVIRSSEGISKGYGFVTFDTEEEAKAVQAMSQEKLKLNGKTLNLGPALRKMVHPRYNSEYAMMLPNSQYTVTSPTMQFSYTYPTPTNGTPYMMGYAPQGMIPVSQSPEEASSPKSLETSGAGGVEEVEQLQHLQQPQQQQSTYIPLQLQNSPQPTVYSSYYAPPPTPMTPTFRGMPCAPLYYPPHTPQMTVDGATLFPQMIGSPLMFAHHPQQQYFPPTPSMDSSAYSNNGGGYLHPHHYQLQSSPPPTVAATSPTDASPSLLLQQQHYPPLLHSASQGLSEDEEGGRRGAGEKKRCDVQLPEDGVKQPETSMGDIRVSYASIAAKIKSAEAAAATVAKEVEQMSSAMGTMKMNGAGGDYAATTKNGVASSPSPRV